MFDEWVQVTWEKETWWLILWCVLDSGEKTGFPKDPSGEAQERIWLGMMLGQKGTGASMAVSFCEEIGPPAMESSLFPLSSNF